MQHLRNMGYLVAVHTPAVLPSYFSYGHFPVADAAYLRANVIPSQKNTRNCCMIDEKEWYRCFPLYEKFAEKYSGIIRRTEEDFLRKAADYAADGGRLLAYIENNIVNGYAFYYQTDNEILCVEAAAEDGYWNHLIEGLFAQGSGLKFSAKLPPDAEISYDFTVLEKLQKGVMGLCDATGLLKALDLQIPYSFRVKDTVVPENNGIFNFQGNASHAEPVFEISAGHLLQVLVGYHSFNELKNEITIYDTEKFEEIDLLMPKQNCYIIDEY
ncbi:MAG: sterol carrier protein domain-containing protein, partial [Anaerotignum sp.]|nr:sterol carrier protein domain-containing protein [Anaerotignum sp.]